MNRNAKWSDFDKRLRADYLGGQPVVFTIRAVEVEETHPRPGVTQSAPVLYFNETDKSLVLSPTNCHTLAGLFGDDVNACVGKRVTLKGVQMQVGGRPTTPIRLSAAGQNAPAPKTEPPAGNGAAAPAGQQSGKAHEGPAPITNPAKILEMINQIANPPYKNIPDVMAALSIRQWPAARDNAGWWAVYDAAMALIAPDILEDGEGDAGEDDGGDADSDDELPY